MKISLRTLVALFIVLGLYAVDVNAQSHRTSEKLLVDHDRYHLQQGWVTSIGINLGNIQDYFNFETDDPESPAWQFELVNYKYLKPRVGLGGGVALKLTPTGSWGYLFQDQYKFVEIFGYSKFYLNNNRRRLYMDAKLGYSITINNDFNYAWCDCINTAPLYIRNFSGPMAHPGIGIDFATSKRIKWGLKLNSYHNYFNIVSDDFEQNYFRDIGESLKTTSDRKIHSGILLGISFYM